jgi:hypothetical protein
MLGRSAHSARAAIHHLIDPLGVCASSSLQEQLKGVTMAGATGLLVGLWVPGIGIAAAVGLGLLMAGAIGAHLRASDARNVGPAAPLLVLAVAVAILQIASL